ncbi:hypothetical protein [Deinococcus aquaticus]|uniref:hypothetical protein n=1 Tax=Deinococcus aquaticus TaxID=328692 RepID=UPI00361E7E20
MLATLLAERGPTLLIDADEKTASAMEWAQAGPGLSCDVIPMEAFENLALDPYSYRCSTPKPVRKQATCWLCPRQSIC